MGVIIDQSIGARSAILFTVSFLTFANKKLCHGSKISLAFVMLKALNNFFIKIFFINVEFEQIKVAWVLKGSGEAIIF